MAGEARPAIEVLPTGEAVAERAADLLAGYMREDVARAGRATLAISGGRTPQSIFTKVARLDLPWDRIDVFQVDERIAPAGHADRNATQARAALGDVTVRHARAFHWMPVEDMNLHAAAERYAAELRATAGSPPTLGTVHLGLGADGHTASIFPGSPLVERSPSDVAVTAEHLGRRRMTLTLAAIDGALRVLWVVTGADKQAALAGLVGGDASVVGSRVRRSGALILADAAAAAALPS